MKNETFVRAVSEIDDDLIAAAYEYTAKSSRKTLLIRICASAACIILILGIAFTFGHTNSIDIFVSGDALSDKPIQISTPAPISEMQREIMPVPITVSLDIRSGNNVKISANEGTIEVYARDTLLYTGNSFEAKEPVTVNWTVDARTLDEEFRLSVNTNSILLSFDKDLNNWTIMKNY